MLANIATIVNGMTHAELEPIAQTFMVAMFLNPLILNSLIYEVIQFRNRLYGKQETHFSEVNTSHTGEDRRFRQKPPLLEAKHRDFKRSRHGFRVF